jgi:hypothetical protein
MEERTRDQQWWIDVRAVEWIIRQFRSLGPYLAIELVLPGGSIVALLLWSFRNRPAARLIAARIATAPYALWTRFTTALRAVSGVNMHRALR